MRQLVSSWVEAEKTGYRNTLAKAIRDLNSKCGMALTHSRLAEWRRGKYTPSPEALSQMLHRVLPWALTRIGINASQAQLRALEDLLWKVNVRNGERYFEHL